MKEEGEAGAMPVLVADRALAMRRMATTRGLGLPALPRRHQGAATARAAGEGEEGGRPSWLRPMDQKTGGGPLAPLPFLFFNFFFQIFFQTHF